MQAFDLKEIQQKREERFMNSLFQESPEQLAIRSPIKLSNQEYVQIFIKAMISPDVVASKALIKSNYLEGNDEDYELIVDDVIVNEQLGMKAEFNVFVERDLVQQIELLRKNYIEKQDLIKMPVCGANGIRLPEEGDFQLYFKFIKVQNSVKETIFVQQQELKYVFGLFICGCIFNDDYAQEAAFTELTRKPTIENVFKLLLVSVQYESRKYMLTLYKLVRSMFYHQAGLLTEELDPLLTAVLANRGTTTFEVLKPNLIKIKSREHVITINTTILYPVYKQYEQEKQDFMKPLAQYSYFQVHRNADITDEFEMNQYPHVYQIKLESTQQMILVAIQQEAHGAINIYRQLSQSEKYARHNESYAGSIKRNLMGTSFKVIDDGYPKKLEHYFPEWIGSLKRELMKIEYETNILASKPRKFDTSFYNFETKSIDSFVTLPPKYNPEKDCYQLHFFGRANVPSARNFQMVKPNDDTTIYLLHGKVGRNIFNLDFRPPLNILQAFSVSMVSISSKFLVS